MATTGDYAQYTSYSRILRISGPLILSHTSVMLMHVVDGLLLARYSPEAIAASSPAGMTAWVFIGLATGLCGYSATFVAQYIGAQSPQRVGAAVWQAVYVALLAGTLIAAVSLAAKPLFTLMGHAPSIAALETTYFRIFCWGAPFFLLCAALGGFFAGRSDNTPLMIVQLSGMGLNAFLAWALIFGRAGLPEMGIAGAATATLAAQALMSVAFLALFLRPTFRRAYQTWASRAIDWSLLRRLIRFGFPSGLRNVVEILAWTVFLVFVGRVGELGLAASSIVWRLNGLAFFPLIGLSIAVSMLVGQAQGAGQPRLAEQAVWRGLALGEVWMALLSAAFVFMPATLIHPFLDPTHLGSFDYDELVHTCTVLLRFVAAYCLLDALNIFLMAALQGAGDTRWTLLASAAVHLLYVLVLMLVVQAGGGLYALWTTATIFVMSNVVVWLARFRGGKWKSMRVIEQAAPLPAVAAAPAPT